MTTERYEQALIRVKAGHTITLIVGSLYGNRHEYNKATSASQRAHISRARAEYMARHNGDKPRQRYPRLFVETSAELRQAVADHCAAREITIAQFVNNAVRLALRMAGEGKSG